MSAFTTIADLRDLAGRAFVSIRQLHVLVDDPWDRVVGPAVQLVGGCEIQIRDSELSQALEAETDDDAECPPGFVVPAFVVDRDYPRASILIRADSLGALFNPIAPNTGPRASGDPSECSHSEFSLSCPACFRKMWIARAISEGVIDGDA